MAGHWLAKNFTNKFWKILPWVPEPQNLHERKLVREKERRKKGGSGQMMTQSRFGADQLDYESIRSPFAR